MRRVVLDVGCISVVAQRNAMSRCRELLVILFAAVMKAKQRRGCIKKLECKAYAIIQDG